jgi:hypothetical protein
MHSKIFSSFKAARVSAQALESKNMKATLATIIFLIVFLPCNSLAGDISGYYSNMTQETKYETYDCGGYTIKIEMILSNDINVYFVAHEGNCGIDGQLVKDVKYEQVSNSLSFTVPFKSSLGNSFYEFKGKIESHIITGDLNIKYPDLSYNKSVHLELVKRDDRFLNKYK